jgi:hypothetical protein
VIVLHIKSSVLELGKGIDSKAIDVSAKGKEEIIFDESHCPFCVHGVSYEGQKL